MSSLRCMNFLQFCPRIDEDKLQIEVINKYANLIEKNKKRLRFHLYIVLVCRGKLFYGRKTERVM